MPYQKHAPVSFSFHLQCSDEILQYARENSIPHHCSQTYVASREDEDVAQKFVGSIEKVVENISNLFLKDEQPMVFTEKDERKFNSAY